MVMQDASGTRSTTASIDTNGVMLFSWTGAHRHLAGPGAFEVHVTANGQTTSRWPVSSWWRGRCSTHE